MTSLKELIFGPTTTKAASGPGVLAMSTLPSLTTLWGNDPNKRMEAYLKAYKVGWFYKAGSKISRDVARLSVYVAPENDEGENQATIIEPDLFTPWDRLDPVGQFLRLMERPNPHQTGFQLRQKTQIRYDFAGAAFWYLESPMPPFGLPTGIYGISPSRMWRSTNARGETVGWIMDRNERGGGVPFSAEEILPFIAGSAEDDGWGVGVVEAVYSQVPLTDLMARHTADVLNTGGRLAGMAWPKNRTLDEAEFKDAQTAWRSVVSDGNSAKRLLLFPEPMEYSAGASTPAEIGIPELATLNRDEILTAFPIGPEMLGVPMPSGLNASGETRRELKRWYNEETLHPRVEEFEETVQVGLLGRYEAAVGYTLDFEVTEPNLDDASTLLEKAAAVRELWNLGFDESESIKAVGLQNIKFVARPAMPTFTGPAEDTPPSTDEVDGDVPQGKSLKARRDRAIEPLVARGRHSLVAFFDDQRQRVIGRIRDTYPTRKAARKADEAWWDASAEDDALRATIRQLYVDIGSKALQEVADQVNRFVRPDQSRPILADLLAYGADRIKDINDKTRVAIKLEVAEGIRRGYSLDQLIDGVPGEGFGGVQKALLDNGVAAFSDTRAETIVRTETALSYNRASLGGYKDFGIREVIAFDGDDDEVCAERNGQTFGVEEALGIEDHPNGTLDWAPVVNFGEKAVDVTERAFDMVGRVMDALTNQSAPVINVTTPPVSVTLPPPPVRTLIDFGPDGDVIGSHEVLLQTRTVYDFDADGQITGTHEEPLDGR